MNGAIPPLPHFAFMAWCSLKNRPRDNFIFRKHFGDLYQRYLSIKVGKGKVVPVLFF
jgi:hypothetical protein